MFEEILEIPPSSCKLSDAIKFHNAESYQMVEGLGANISASLFVTYHFMSFLRKITFLEYLPDGNQVKA